MGTLSPIHWIIVIVVVLLLFGSSRLAAMGKGVGEGLRSLRKGLDGDPLEKDAERRANTPPDAPKGPPDAPKGPPDAPS